MKTERIEIPYGSDNVPLDIPEERLAGIYGPRDESHPSAADLKRAVESSNIHSSCRGRNVCVLLEDETRGDMQERYLEALLPVLKGAKQVSVIIATGSHDAMSEGNTGISFRVRKLLDECRIDNDVTVNDCRSSEFRYYGRTRRGTDVYLNAAAHDAETMILPSTMKPHYFAGYSNPVKNLVPGIASFETIERNHSLTLEKDSTFCRHPLHPHENRRSNPVAEDMMEAAELFLRDRLAFALAAAGGRVFAGHMYQAASRGMSVVDELMACSVRPERYIIVSPGGLQEGRDMYHAQRGLELTRNAVLDGGEILFVAEMSGGIAYDDSTRLNFHERLKQPEKLHPEREDYVLYCHKAVRLHELIKKVAKIHVLSSLDDASLREIRMAPAGSCQEVVDGWLDKDSDARILVFNSANRLAVYQKEDPVS